MTTTTDHRHGTHYAQPDPKQAHLDGHRDGATYDATQDYARLNKQARRVFNAMSDGMWRTLRQIADTTGDPEASVSARLRDLRKQRFGAHTVEARRVAGARRATWVYRVVPKA